MKNFAVLLLAAATTLQSAELPKQAAPNEVSGMEAARLARIPTAMQQFVDRGSAAGFVTLIARHGKIVFLRAIGYQDVATKTPMRTDTIFRIKSMTKPMTAAAIMILVDEARLSLLDPVEQYLPEFKGLKLDPCAHAKQPDCTLIAPARAFTVRDLLTHTSGLQDGPDQFAPTLHTLADRVAAGARMPLAAEPGTIWHYTNIGYATLGRLIEAASGQSYESFMATRLFAPLAMNDTAFSLPAEKQTRLATLYTADATGKLTRAGSQPTDEFGAKIPAPEGGLFSTAADQFHFYQMLIDKGLFQGQRILSVAAIEAMTTNETDDIKGIEFSPGLGMGFGFGVIKEASGTFRYQPIGTFLKGGAYRTMAWGDPTHDLIGILMYQRTNGGGDMAPETTAFITLTQAAIHSN